MNGYVKENRETNCDDNDDTFEVFLSASFRLMAAVGMMVLLLLLLQSPLPFFVISCSLELKLNFEADKQQTCLMRRTTMC